MTPRAQAAAWGVGAALLLSGCPKGSHAASSARDLSQFECNERQVGYTVVGGFIADEAGIAMQCEGENPQILKWQSDSTGIRKQKEFPLTAEQFDSVWEKIDATGWRNLGQDCKNPNAQGGDPSYMIDVGDYAMSVTFNCDGKTLPFPYDRIVNELDLRAVGFGVQDPGVP